MAKVAPMTEQFQHFPEEMRESFWGEMYGKTKQLWQQWLAAESERERSRYCGRGWYERSAQEREYRNGYYERDFVTRFGTIRLRVALQSGPRILTAGAGGFQRRAAEVALLIREAFLRGISTRQVGLQWWPP